MKNSFHRWTLGFPTLSKTYSLNNLNLRSGNGYIDNRKNIVDRFNKHCLMFTHPEQVLKTSNIDVLLWVFPIHLSAKYSIMFATAMISVGNMLATKYCQNHPWLVEFYRFIVFHFTDLEADKIYFLILTVEHTVDGESIKKR